MNFTHLKIFKFFRPVASGPHPVDNLTQLMPHGVPGQPYGPFEGRGAGGAGGGAGRRVQLCRYIQPIHVYGLENVTVI